MRRSLWVVSFAAVGAASFLAFSTWSRASGDSLLHEDAAVVAEGKVLYDQNCASCHGTNLQGEPNWRDRDADGYLPAPPHDETGHTWHHPTAQLMEITRLGTEAVVGGGYKSNMIGFGDVLTDSEIGAILAYIKSTWPERIIRGHNQLDAAYNEATKP